MNEDKKIKVGTTKVSFSHTFREPATFGIEVQLWNDLGSFFNFNIEEANEVVKNALRDYVNDKNKNDQTP